MYPTVASRLVSPSRHASGGGPANLLRSYFSISLETLESFTSAAFSCVADVCWRMLTYARKVRLIFLSTFASFFYAFACVEKCQMKLRRQIRETMVCPISFPLFCMVWCIRDASRTARFHLDADVCWRMLCGCSWRMLAYAMLGGVMHLWYI